MLKIKPIEEKDYDKFIKKSNLTSIYESLDWYHLKQNEKKKCELIGLFDDDKLVGVSLIIYVGILRKYRYAYACRGFVYDYSDIDGFKVALNEYFKTKNVVFVRIDPPFILNEYVQKMEKVSYEESNEIINRLKSSGFLHYGFNNAFETMQFRFVHALKCEKTFEDQLSLMNKSTRKNIELSESYGVKVKEVSKDSFDEVYRLFQETVDRKKFDGLSKEYYLRLIDTLKDNVILYIAYIDKKLLQSNMNAELSSLEKELKDLNKLIEKNNMGTKLLKRKETIENSITKCKEMIDYSNSLKDETNIASMLCIKDHNEIVSYVSGMDNEYRNFRPKYALYPEMIKYAINNKLELVNFLGVKNIFDKNDKDYGILDVKRGFGGATIEYIGEFDLPLKPFLYRFYKLKENHERKKANGN